MKKRKEGELPIEEGFKWKHRDVDIKMPLKDYIKKIINEEKAKGIDLSVAVGTDSQRHGRGYKFATVIVIYMKEDLGGGVIKSLGGKMITSTYNMHSLRKGKEGVNERMIVEVSKSIEVAYDIGKMLDEHYIKMEIHADINPDPRWESNKAMAAAIGYILGMGYEFKIKPDAFASSFSADRFAQ